MIVPAMLGILTGITFVIVFQLGRIIRVLGEIRDKP